MPDTLSRKTLTDLISEQAGGSVVLVRADLNVPLDDDYKLRDATRLMRILPTLKILSEAGMKIGIISHFGRPKGQYVAAMSLRPVASALAELLKKPVSFAENCIGEAAQSALYKLPDGGICVLENTRFHGGETANDSDFAKQLAAPAQAFVSDAFSVAHRAHASNVGIAAYLPTYCGCAMQAELDALEAALGNPKHPVVAVIGGAKISTKLALLGNLSRKVDVLVIGGGMANSFLAAQGYDIGKSLCETAMLETARDILATAAQNKCQILLPQDVQLAKQFAANQKVTSAPIDDIPPEQMILDVGSQSVAAICAAFEAAKTLIWNGPLGAFEIVPFDAATNQTARHAAQLTQAGKLISVAGGGDTVAALNHAGIGDDFTYISTAGGAFLEWMEGKKLAGVEVLMQ